MKIYLCVVLLILGYVSAGVSLATDSCNGSSVVNKGCASITSSTCKYKRESAGSNYYYDCVWDSGNKSCSAKTTKCRK